MLESLAQLVSIVQPFIPLIGGTVATLSLAGIMPRVGPGRALFIAARSKFRFFKGPFTDRQEDLAKLHDALSNVLRSQYVVVTGPKGVGKTCLVESATRYTCGVMKVKVKAGKDEEEIVQDTLLNLTGIRFSFLKPHASARRVIFYYNLFGRHPPLVVINASERKIGDSYASLTGAVRTLVDDYGLRVVVDSSPNSLDPGFLATKRQDILRIDPMPRDIIERLPQLQPLITLCRENKLDSVAWKVLGGSPADYELLLTAVKKNQHKPDFDPKKVIGDFLTAQIYDAIEKVNAYKKKHPRMEEILEMFTVSESVPDKLLVEKKLEQPTPDKVLRLIENQGIPTLIPATYPLQVVLRHRMSGKPAFEDLIQLLDK